MAGFVEAFVRLVESVEAEAKGSTRERVKVDPDTLAEIKYIRGGGWKHSKEYYS